MREDTAHLVVREEPLADVVQLEHGQRGTDLQSARKDAELDHPAEGSQFMVDRPAGGAGGQPRRDVARHAVVVDPCRRQVLEHGTKMQQGVFNAPPGPVTLLDVVGLDQGHEVVEGHLLGVEPGKPPPGLLPLPKLQEAYGRFLLVGLRGFAVELAPERVLYPPDRAALVDATRAAGLLRLGPPLSPLLPYWSEATMFPTVCPSGACQKSNQPVAATWKSVASIVYSLW